MSAGDVAPTGREAAAKQSPAHSRARAREHLPSAADFERVLIPAVIALSAAALLWSRLIMVTQSLWGDEAFSVTRYIRGGPSAIWDPSKWLPNNHMLFEFLTWATTAVLGVQIEATWRLWSVLPAIAAAVVMTWWLWRRIDRWTAAIFAVLATVAPLYFDLGVQARGYGLTFLAAVVLITAADGLIQTGSRAALVTFGLAGFVGMATLENFVGAFLAAAAVLATVSRLRRQTIVTVACVGAATLAWYAPLLSVVIGYQNPHGPTLPWYGFVIAPLRDLFGQGIHALVPSVSVTGGAILAALALAAGTLVLWRRHERRLILLLLAPQIATYLLIEVAAKYTPRFASFAMLPLLALAAAGLAAGGRQMARQRHLMIPSLALLVVCSLLALGAFLPYAAKFSEVPFESAKTAGQIVVGGGGPADTGPLVTNIGLGAPGFYVAPRRILALGTARLARLFCTYPGKFVYYEQGVSELPNTSCLARRGAFRVALPERRSRQWVWLVPARIVTTGAVKRRR